MKQFSAIFAIVIGVSLSTLAIAENPFAKPDDSWIAISGTVVSSTKNSFRLDYGDGIVTVEMDDWDTWGDASGLIAGDEVTVYGEVDDDLYEVTTLEANSVYVEDLNTYFYASSADEESASPWLEVAPIALNRATVSGTVSSVDKNKEKFTIDRGKQKLTVEVDELGYNPLDNMGFQQIDRGDVVSASGDIDYEFFKGRVLEADTVITLTEDTA